MSRKILFISVIFIVAVFSLGQNHSVLATDTPPFYQFTPVRTKQLYASANAGASRDVCPVVDVDNAYYLYTLVVTEELLADLQSAIAAGENPAIEYKISHQVVELGQSEVKTNADLWFAADSGEVYKVLDQIAVEDLNGDNPPWQVTPHIDEIGVGDTLIIGGTASGSANSVGCNPIDQAINQWELEGPVIDSPDRPILRLHP